MNRISYDEGQKFSREIKDALNVEGVQYSDIFLLDNWSVTEGLTYLTGAYFINEYIDETSTYIHVRTLDCYSYHSQEFQHITSAFQSRYDRLLLIWQSGTHIHVNPPKYYIDWAISKKINISWLGWAVEEGIYTSTESALIDKPLNARTENNYLRLIMALAYGIKGFNPQKPYEAAQLIIDETEVKISKETLAAYISKAHELESKSRG